MVMGSDDSCWRMSLCRVGVQLSPEYDVKLAGCICGLMITSGSMGRGQRQ